MRLSNLLFARSRVTHSFWSGCCIAFFSFLLSVPVSAENLVELRWREQNEALIALEQSVARTAQAQEGLVHVYADLANASLQLDESNSDYIVVLDRYYAVLVALEEQYKQRLLAQALPEFLISTRDELRNRRDAWINAQSAGNKPFREALQLAQRDYSTAFRDVTEAIENGNRTIAEVIDPEIQRLQARKQELILELADLAHVEYDADMTGKWFNAAQNLFAAELVQTENTRSLDDSYKAFITALGDASPPFLQSVKVTAGDQIFYDFSWIREGYEDDVTASIEYARQRDQIADDLPNYTDILRSISVERELMHLDRWHLAINMHSLSAKLVELGDEHYYLERNQILATMFAEMGIAVAEAVLTGGIATAVRRAEEVAERRLLEATIGNKHLVEDVEDFAVGEVSERLRRAVADSGQEQFERVVETLQNQRAAYVAFEVEEMVLGRLRSQNLHFDSLAEASQNVLPERVNRLVREATPAVESRANRLFPEMEFYELQGDLLERRVTAAQREIFTQENAAEVGLEASKTTAAKHLDLYGAYLDDQQRALVHNPNTTDVGEIFKGQAIEWGVGVGIDAGIEVRQIISSGANYTGLQGVGRQAVIGAAFSITEASVKTFISNHYEGKIIETEAEYWSTFAQLAAMQQYYYHMTVQDEELAQSENWYRDAVNKMNVYLSEIGLPRRPGGGISSPQEIPAEFDVAVVELSFSTPLTTPPIVYIGNKALQVTGDGRFWRTTIEILPIYRDSGFATMSVEAGPGNQVYMDIDARPETIAYMVYDQPDWIGYDRGSDTRHILTFQEKQQPQLECLAMLAAGARPPLCIIGAEVVYRPAHGGIADAVWTLATMDGTPLNLGIEVPMNANLSYSDGSPVGRGAHTYHGSVIRGGTSEMPASQGFLEFNWNLNAGYQVIVTPEGTNSPKATIVIKANFGE